jgi:3-oxoadipate enol-lactonase
MKKWVNGIQIAYDVFGQLMPPLVLMHGFGLDRSIWQALAVQHLGDQQVILPDLRGHGESDAPQGPYSMPLMAQDIAALLDLLEVDQTIICGHSMSGYVALAFAEQYAHKLAGFAMITSNAGADSAEKRAGRYTMIDNVRKQGSAAVAESLAPRLSHKQAVINLTKTLINKTSPEGLIGALEGMAARKDRTALLSEIVVPALVVAGEDDQITDYEDARCMAQTLPKGEFLGIAGTAHMPMVEAPPILGEGLQTLVVRVLNNKAS